MTKRGIFGRNQLTIPESNLIRPSVTEGRIGRSYPGSLSSFPGNKENDGVHKIEIALQEVKKDSHRGGTRGDGATIEERENGRLEDVDRNAGKKMIKICRKAPILCQENRKAWLEKRNTLIKSSTTPEPSLLSSSLISNNISLNSCDFHHDLCSRDWCRDKISPGRIFFETSTQQLKEEDRKILRLMALRREAAIRDEETANTLRSMWAKERQEYEKNIKDKKKSWNDYIAQKRKIESLKNCWRKKSQMDVLKEERLNLESRINERHERIERRRKEICDQKKLKPESDKFLQEVMHTQLRRQQEWEEEIKDALKLKCYKDKSRRAEEKLKLILNEKLKRIKEAGLRRDIKWQAAKDLREEMRRKGEEIQKENIKREEMYQAVREHRVMNGIEWKKKMALERNHMKKEYHAFIYNKIKEEEREKEMQARLCLEAKEARIKAIREKKQSAITKSRSCSRMAANLRQKIKSSYNFSK